MNKKETIPKYGTHQVEIWCRSYAIRPLDGESLEDTFNSTVPIQTKKRATIKA